VSKPSLTIALLCRNEAKRWLPALLPAWKEFADVITAVDDGSTDGTRELLKKHGAKVHSTKSKDQAWGSEWVPRSVLWEQAVKAGTDWIMVLDADMIPANDPSILLDKKADAIAFRLYDLWQTTPLAYRCDGAWQAHLHSRVWAVKNPGKKFVAEWNERGIHCGHFPRNLSAGRTIQAPEEYSLLHYAYSDATERQKKHAQYLSKQNQLTMVELAHADSIIKPAVVNLLPFTPQWQIQKSS